MSLHSPEVHGLAIALAAGFAAAFVGIAALIRFWRADLGSDAGDGVRKLQEKPILRLGGLPIYAVFLAAFLFLNRIGAGAGAGNAEVAFPVAFLFLGTGFFLLGFLDDLFGVPAKLKLAAQVSLAFGAFYSGMRIEVISNPFGSGQVELGHLGLILTVLWFVALPNLINLIDGMDGLAGGVTLFLMGTLAVLGVMTGHFALALLCMVVIGGILAFLFFNLPPAKIYMGDGGSYFLGFLIAAASLISSSKGSIFGALLVVLIALGFPILDTLFAITRRALSGLPVMAPDARHIHHRLMTLGFSKRTILMVLYGVMAGLCLIGLSLFVSKGYTVSIAGMILLLAIFMGLRFVGFPRGLAEVKVILRDIFAARKDIRYAYTLAQVLEHEIDRVGSAEEFWDSLLAAMAKLGIEPVGDKGGGARVRNPGRCAVIYSISGEQAWHLYCPVPTSRRRQWDRVIRCFVPALMNGAERFGGFPKQLGLLRGETAGIFRDFENLLNGEAPSASTRERPTGFLTPLPGIANRAARKEMSNPIRTQSA